MSGYILLRNTGCSKTALTKGKAQKNSLSRTVLYKQSTYAIKNTLCLTHVETWMFVHNFINNEIIVATISK